MAVQTSYQENIAKGYEGQVANETDFDIDTKKVETVAGIAFGRAVSRGTDDKGCVLGGADFIGVTVRDQTQPVQNDDKYTQYDLAGILRKGDIWLKPSEGVTDGAQVYYDTTTGRFGVSGGGKTAIVGAVWQTTADADTLAVARFNSPQH